MTAEIAILNKQAVALAADSAVTISASLKEEKIFDSADKLFELSNHNPIGIMLYNGMSFMEAPLPSLIRQFRNNCCAAKNVEQAAEKFLEYLQEFGRKSPTSVHDVHIDSLVRPVIGAVVAEFKKALDKEV
jgi:hypothetical protein